VDGAAAKAGLDPLWPDGQPDRVAAERHLLLALLSRAERMLAWSHYRMTDAGEPANPSLFLDDIEDLFDPAPELLVRRLGETGWEEDPRLAPSEFQLALAGLSAREGREEPYRLATPAAVESLSGRGVWSATALELYLRCPVAWFVERFIRPENLEPDSESLRFGDAAHRALKAVFETLPEGERRLTEENVEGALAVLEETVETIELLSPDPVQERIMRRRMGRMLSGFLRQEAASGSQFVPAEFEMEFGSGGSPPADLGDGLVLRGQIDRVDRDGGDAIVLDYKSGSTSQDWPAAKWLERGVLQAALYALVYEQEKPGERVVGSMYASLRADSKGPRGAIEAEADMERTDITGTDRKSFDEFRELLEEARELAAGAVARIGEGDLSPTDTPERCAFTRDGGCAHPEICRRYR
jgi:RecB family exonuclease